MKINPLNIILIIILSTITPNLVPAQLINDRMINNDSSSQVGCFNIRSSINKNGDFVVVWRKDSVQGGNLYAQIFDKNFNKIGGNILVNNIPNSALFPDVAIRNDGTFGIVWTGPGNYNWGGKVNFKLYNKEGLAISNEIQINDTLLPMTPTPRIVSDNKNRFIIAFDYAITNPNYKDVWFQILDSNLNKIGKNTKVNDMWSNGNPAIAVRKDGSLIITWEGGYYLPNDLYCQMFSAAGTRIGNNIKVNDYEIDSLHIHQNLPDIASDSSGNFYISFSEYDDGEYVKYQRFNKFGEKMGQNVYLGAFAKVNIYSNDEGDLAFLLTNPALIYNHIYNLRIDRNGNQIGTKFRVSNQYTDKEKYGEQLILFDNKIINLWHDYRYSLPGYSTPQAYFNVRSYINPDSTVSVNNLCSEIPQVFKVEQNYPNPFNSETKIKFEIPKINIIDFKIEIYDVSGKLYYIYNNKNILSGIYKFSINGNNWSSGIYFTKIKLNNQVITKKIVIIK